MFSIFYNILVDFCWYNFIKFQIFVFIIIVYIFSSMIVDTNHIPKRIFFPENFYNLKKITVTPLVQKMSSLFPFLSFIFLKFSFPSF